MYIQTRPPHILEIMDEWNSEQHQQKWSTLEKCLEAQLELKEVT